MSDFALSHLECVMDCDCLVPAMEPDYTHSDALWVGGASYQKVMVVPNPSHRRKD